MQASSYGYGPKGRRVSKTVQESPTVSPLTTHFVYEGDEPVADHLGTTGAVLRRYVNGLSIDERLLYVPYDISTGAASEVYNYRTNYQGTVIALSKQTTQSTLHTRYSYDAYGVPGEADDAQPFRYTGRRYDVETGLYYYRARYYDPRLGRFLQTDPIGYEDNMNLYAYTNNDPINNTDPTGMVKVPPSPCSFEGAKDSGASSVTCLEGWGGGSGGADDNKKKKDQPCCSLNDTGRGTATSTLNDDGSTTPELNYTGGDIPVEIQQLMLEFGITSIPAYGQGMTGIPMLKAGIPSATASSVKNIPSIASPEAVLQNPKVLRGLSPANLLGTLKRIGANWRIEPLAKGSASGRGLVLREYRNGIATGRMIRYHPGGARKGIGPYWRVNAGQGQTPPIPGSY